MTNTLVYKHNNSLYINLTNKCTNNCEFCVRNTSDGIDGSNLWLKSEPTADDVIEVLSKYEITKYDEVVFCGFGEPMLRLDTLVDIAKFLKNKYPELKTRINTNGQANLYYKRDITPLLSGLIDVVSISLNAPDAKEYQEICHSDYGEKAFDGLLEFAKSASKYVPKVRLSVVDIIGEEKIERCRKVANNIGIELFVRELI
jgi:TatD family-associated radical SAM protein